MGFSFFAIPLGDYTHKNHMGFSHRSSNPMGVPMETPRRFYGMDIPGRRKFHWDRIWLSIP